MKRPTEVERAAIAWASDSFGSAGELRRAVARAFPNAVERNRRAREKAAIDAMFTGNVPAWVKRFVTKHGPRVDHVTIRQSRTKPYDSGHCTGREIIVTFGAGTSEDVRKMVILHEIAHSIVPYDRHGPKFYAEWRRLLAAEGLLRKAVESGRFGTRRAAKLRHAAVPRPK